jgi:hypothetical protein
VCRKRDWLAALPDIAAKNSIRERADPPPFTASFRPGSDQHDVVEERQRMTRHTPDGVPAGADAHAIAASPRLFLTIRRGRTRFPRRPLEGESFLIGSGPDCQLRLGGTVPAHHSTIALVDNEPRIAAVAAQPPLRVNGAECRESVVRSGDLIEIGPFALAVEMPQPAELTAAELVSLLESEQALVDEFESGRLRGGEALFNAVHRRVDELSRAPAEAAPDFLEDLESAVDLLHEFSDEMERRAGVKSQREAGFNRAAQRLLAAQQRLIAQIDAIQHRITAHDDEQPTPLRKVA